MNRQLAFIDEFGNSGLDFGKEDVSTHFIVTSILIDQTTLDESESKVNKIRNKYFQQRRKEVENSSRFQRCRLSHIRSGY